MRGKAGTRGLTRSTAGAHAGAGALSYCPLWTSECLKSATRRRTVVSTFRMSKYHEPCPALTLPDRLRLLLFVPTNSARKRLPPRSRGSMLASRFVLWETRNMELIERGVATSRTLVPCMSRAGLGLGCVTLERSTVLFCHPAKAEHHLIQLPLANASFPPIRQDRI
jgi:hypothetical protein